MSHPDALESYHLAVNECRALVDEISSLPQSGRGLKEVLLGKAQPKAPSEQSLKRRLRKRLAKLQDCYKRARAQEQDAQPTLVASRRQNRLPLPYVSVWGEKGERVDTAHEAVLDRIEYVLCLGVHVGVPFETMQWKQKAVANSVKQNQACPKLPPWHVRNGWRTQRQSHSFKNQDLEAFYRMLEHQRFPKPDQLGHEYVLALKFRETPQPVVKPKKAEPPKQPEPAAKKGKGEGDGGDGTTPAEPKLTDKHIDTLESLRLLKATSRDKRKTAAEIARRFAGDADPALVKEPLAELARWGYVESLQGRSGGSWITAQGRKRLTDAKRKR